MAEQIKQQWAWVAQLVHTDEQQQQNNLRKAVQAARQTVTNCANIVNIANDHAHMLKDKIQQPSQASLKAWDRLLEVRRQNPALVVGALTALSIIPGMRHIAVSKFTALRLIARNTVVSASAGFIFLYPEFVLRTAPRVTQAADAVKNVATGGSNEQG